MTRKEAAGVIKFEKACVLRQDTPRCNRDCKKCDLLLPTEDVLTAYDMAIKALEQEPSREFEDYENCKECRKDWTKCGTCSVMMQWLKDNKQEPCEDCISKKAVLDKINEICFSREQESVDFRVSKGSNGQRDLIINFIENLPSIQSMPKVLDKIRAEVRSMSGDIETLSDVICIIDKYRAESEYYRQIQGRK